MKRSKLQTIGYIFLNTVFLQIIVLLTFCSVGIWALCATYYNSFVFWILGAGGFVTMLFVFVCVSVFSHAYGVSIFAKTRKAFDANRYKSEPIKRYDYSLGRKDLITGNRSIYVREREVKTGGPLVAMGFMAIVVGLTGIFKFVVEALRVCVSSSRQMAWEEAREYMHEKMHEEKSVVAFFQVPIVCAIILALIWVGAVFGLIYSADTYSDDCIEFQITEKYNSENNRIRIHTLFYGTLKNTGNKEIRSVEGTVYFKDANGKILYEGEVSFHAALDEENDYLEADELWDIALQIHTSPDDVNAQYVWNAELEDIEISIDISEIVFDNAKWYSSSKIMEFPKEEILIIKPIGE